MSLHHIYGFKIGRNSKDYIKIKVEGYREIVSIEALISRLAIIRDKIYNKPIPKAANYLYYVDHNKWLEDDNKRVKRYNNFLIGNGIGSNLEDYSTYVNELEPLTLKQFYNLIGYDHKQGKLQGKTLLKFFTDEISKGETNKPSKEDSYWYKHKLILDTFKANNKELF